MTQVEISKGIVLDVDFDRIMAHEEVVAAAVRFAVKQALTNTHAGINKKAMPELSDEQVVAQSRAAAEKRLEAMYGGSWGQTERGSRGDAVARQMRDLAESELKSRVKTAGLKFADIKPDVWKASVAKHVAANEERFRKAAEAILAIRPEEPEAPVDLADLGLVAE